MFKIIISSIFLIISITTLGQNKISGKIFDKQGQPLPFANVVLYRVESSDMYKGFISDEKGNYAFENVANGIYQIEISVLGFKTKKSEKIQLLSDKILNFTLQDETQILNEVIIKSKRPVIKQTVEKLVVDLEKSEMVNSNLKDVIKRLPGIVITNNGINFAGRSDVRIMINGKTTNYIDLTTLLQDLPADNIAKVELIEQPGVEFDSEGSGPLINIILKKNVRLGFYGNINTWMGENENFEYGTSASIASYKNKLNWQANIGHSSSTWRDDFFIKRTVVNPILQEETVYNQTTIEPYDPKSIWFGGNLDFYIKKEHSIGFGASYRKSASNRISRSKTLITSPSINERLVSENSFDRDRNTISINPYYEFKSNLNKLAVDLNYAHFTNDNIDMVSEALGSTIDITNRKYLQEGKFTIKTYKIDYTRMFSDDFKWSLGSKYAIVNTDSDLKSYNLNPNTNNFDFQIDNSNRFLIDETIFAIYSKLNINIGKWSFLGGLRYEDSDTKGFSVNTNERQSRKISKFFPSASISRKIKENLGANLSYNYRVRRPPYNNLNSFVQFYGVLTSEVGNPNLKPSFTNNYQFNLTFNKKPFFTIAYSDTKDDLFLFISQDDVTAEVSRTRINLFERKNWNFRLFGPLNFIKRLEGFTGFIVYYDKFESKDLNPQLKLSKWNYGWYTQASYELPWKIRAEMTSYFGSGTLEDQIDVEWIGNLDFSFGRKFLNDRLKINLGINKVLNRGYVGTVNYDNVNAEIESNGSRQNVQLRLTYSFGYKFGKKKNDRNSSKEEKNRINDNN